MPNIGSLVRRERDPDLRDTKEDGKEKDYIASTRGRKRLSEGEGC